MSQSEIDLEEEWTGNTSNKPSVSFSPALRECEELLFSGAENSVLDRYPLLRKLSLVAALAIILVVTGIAVFLITWMFTSDPAKTYPQAIIISIDGFRYDYVNMYANRMPNIMAMRAAGVRAEYMLPVFPSMTFTNHYTLITGLFPESSGILTNTMYDPVFNATYKITDPQAVSDGRWYNGEPFWVTARKNKLKSATYFWPGSEAAIDGWRPNYYLPYDKAQSSRQRVQGLLAWLKLPPATRPWFSTLYFDVVDTAGHDHGPNSTAVSNACADVDEAIGALNQGLAEIGLKDSMNIILVSDHGMTDLSRDRVIFLDDAVPAELLAQCAFLSLSVPTWIIPPEGMLDVFYQNLSTLSHMEVYLKENLPSHLHIKANRRTTPLVLVPEFGWSISTHADFNGNPQKFTGGGHGFLTNESEMRSFFQAIGPDFRENSTFETLNATDVFGILVQLYRISNSPMTNGTSGLPVFKQQKN